MASEIVGWRGDVDKSGAVGDITSVRDLGEERYDPRGEEIERRYRGGSRRANVAGAYLVISVDWITRLRCQLASTRGLVAVQHGSRYPRDVSFEFSLRSAAIARIPHNTQTQSLFLSFSLSPVCVCVCTLDSRRRICLSTRYRGALIAVRECSTCLSTHSGPEDKSVDRLSASRYR